MKKASGNLKVGDLIRVEENQRVPCDLVLI